MVHGNRAAPSLARFLVVLLLGGGSTSAQSNVFRSSDLRELRSVDDLELSPDESVIIYTELERASSRSATGRLMRLDLGSGESRVFRESGSQPRFSPDGSMVALIGGEDGSYGLIVARADGSDSRFLAPVLGTNHPLPSTGERLAWSPDGKAIAFVSATAGPEREASGDPVVIRRYLYKPTASEGSTRFNDNRRTHLFLADLETGLVRQLTDGPHYEHSIAYSPGGDEILFVSNREPDPDRFFNYDVFSLSVEDGAIRRVTRTENAEYRPRFSPDGSRIVYEGTRRGLTSSETTMEDTHVWVMSSDGGERTEIGRVDNRQRQARFSPDGRWVLFTVQERGSTALYRVPAQGGDPEPVLRERGNLRDWAMGPSGLLAYVFHPTDDMAQIYTMRPGSSPRKRTDSNRELLDRRELAPVVAVDYQSFDGLEVQAFLTMPLGRRPGSRHPMITMIKGGPHGQNGPSFNHKAQSYAARGWATLQVNYRGSTGYGQAFADAIFGDQNGGEAKDVLYGVQAALRRYGFLDPERLGIEGGSYGGQLTNWLITQTDMFRAAIPRSGISNLISFNYMAYYHDYLAVEFGGYPHQDDLMDRLWERSPLKHVAKVRTPVMFAHGENDNDVPIAEAEQFYIALHDVGVETVMVRYPREGHGIRELDHQIDLIDRSIAWYEGHFGGRAEGTSGNE